MGTGVSFGYRVLFLHTEFFFVLQIWCYAIYANEGTFVSRPHFYQLFPCGNFLSASHLTFYSNLLVLLFRFPNILSMPMQITNMLDKVPSFKQGGAFWFTDLTTPDTMYIFPVLTALTFWITVEVSYIVIISIFCWTSLSRSDFVKLSNLVINIFSVTLTTFSHNLCMLGEVEEIPITNVLYHFQLDMDVFQ